MFVTLKKGEKYEVRRGLSNKNKTGTNLKSPLDGLDETKTKDGLKQKEMEAKGLKGKSNECRLNSERKKEKGQKTQM